jgi:hypothetical protein
VAGLLVVIFLVLTRRDRVRAFGMAFDTSEVESAQARHQ